jgi:hypothetical protein
VTNEPIGTRITLSLLTLSGAALRSSNTTVILDDDRIVATFDLEGELPPGTYLVRSESSTSTTLHKVILQR